MTNAEQKLAGIHAAFAGVEAMVAAVVPTGLSREEIVDCRMRSMKFLAPDKTPEERAAIFSSLLACALTLLREERAKTEFAE